MAHTLLQNALNHRQRSTGPSEIRLLSFKSSILKIPSASQMTSLSNVLLCMRSLTSLRASDQVLISSA